MNYILCLLKFVVVSLLVFGNKFTASVFFNLRNVSGSLAELPISAHIGLHSHAKLPCLVNLALLEHKSIAFECS